MLPKILEFGLKRGEKNRADITDALSIALMEHLNVLERNLGIIGTIAVISRSSVCSERCSASSAPSKTSR